MLEISNTHSDNDSPMTLAGEFGVSRTQPSLSAAVYRGDDRRQRYAGSGVSSSTYVIAALCVGVLLSIIAIEQMGIIPAFAWGASTDVGKVLDSVGLAAALLAVLALREQYRVSNRSIAARQAALLAGIALCVYPVDIFGTGSHPWAEIDTIARGGVIAIALALVLGAEKSRFTWNEWVGTHVAVLSVASAIAALHHLSGLEIVHLGLTSTRALSAGALILIALIVATHGLRKRQSIFGWMAVLFLAMAVADAQSAADVLSPLSVVASKTGRLLAIAGILYVAVIELRDMVFCERDAAAEARAETARAADRLVQELDVQQRLVHDARNALVAIQGGLGSIGGHTDDDDDGDTAMLEAIRLEVTRLRSSFEDPNHENLPRSFEITSSLSPMVSCYAAAGYSVTMYAPGPIWAQGRASATAEAAQNVIDNAIRYAPEGDICVWMTGTDHHVEIRIGDRGAGIANDGHESIFERGNTQGSGSGIGLHVSRRLIEQQNGTLEATARHGGGSIFVIKLPVGHPPVLHDDSLVVSDDVTSSHPTAPVSTPPR